MSTTVEDITAKLENATVDEPVAATTTTAEAASDAHVASDAHAASAAEGRRLYIGNLAYATTDENLRAFFEGYQIEDTSIPNNPRTGRAVGYAFVDLKTKEEAERAIQELSGKELVERKVSVQIARKPTPKAEKVEGEQTTEGNENANGNGEAKRGRGGARGRGRGKGGRGGLKNKAENGQDEHPTNVPGQVLPLTETTNITPETTAAPKAATEEKDKKKKEVEPKEKVQKKRGPPENGVPSKTKVMVANLPYELSEEKLKELFAAYEPVSAKIALRPIPRFMVRKLQARKEPRKGRGFGFVTLASEELQQKAVDDMNGKEVEGREIAVKVAIDNPAKLEEAEAEAAAAENKAAEDTPAEDKATEAVTEETKTNGTAAPAEKAPEAVAVPAATAA